MVFSRRNTKNCFEIVVDTNIIFSAVLYQHGKPRRLFDLAEERKAKIVVLDHSFEELKAIQSVKGLDIQNVILFLETYQNIQKKEVGDIPDNTALLAKALLSDEGDRPIFAYVHKQITGGTDCYLVTGDKHLLTAEVKTALKGHVSTVSDFIQSWDDFKLVC